MFPWKLNRLLRKLAAEVKKQPFLNISFLPVGRKQNGKKTLLMETFNL